MRNNEKTADLAASEARYRALFDHALDGLFIIDMQGRFLDANPAACQMLGYSQEELLAMDVFQVEGQRQALPPEQQARLLNEMQAMWRRGATGYQTQLLTKSGKSIAVEMTITPLNCNGQEAVLGVARDIAARVRAEEAVKEHSERLEEMMEERTRELKETQEQLVRQEKLAMLGRLAGGVGHELRNPLGAISNAVYYLNMVLETPRSDVKETLEILVREMRVAEGIISSLLDFARVRSPTRRRVDINDLVQETLSRATVPGNIAVVCRLDRELPIILADPNQLSQVFGNIIANAIQAMPEGGRLTVRSKAIDGDDPADGAGWALISFTDTGVGIPDQNLDKVFDPLFTTKSKGIGLGLALVKTLVEGHGGAVGVESEVEKGSTFSVRLPLNGQKALALA